MRFRVIKRRAWDYEAQGCQTPERDRQPRWFVIERCATRWGARLAIRRYRKWYREETATPIVVWEHPPRDR
jgi:hypothetical protein